MSWTFYPAFPPPLFPAPLWAGYQAGTPPPPPPPPPPPTYALFEVAFATFLRDHVPGITAWHAVIPEKVTTYPAVAWQVVDGDSALNLAGAAGLLNRHVQVAVFSRNPSDLWTWAEAIRKALTGPAGKAAFDACNAHLARSGYTADANDSSKGTHSSMREYFLWYPEQET